MEPPKISRRAAEPVYRQIAAWLKTRIEAGDYGPDDPLPSEKDLMGMFDVGRDAARHAVQFLRDEGLVVIVPRRGVYIKPQD